MKITDRTILDHVVEVYVTPEGTFQVREQGERVVIATGDTMKQALRAARMEYRKEQIRVAVPFTLLKDGKLYPAIARGFHAKDRHRLLIWFDDGTKEGKNDQIETWSYRQTNNHLVPDIPEKDLTRIQKLLERRVKLSELTVECNRLIDEWQTAHTFDLPTETRKALEEAAESQPEEEDDQSPVSTSEDKEVDELLGGSDE